MDLSSFQNIKKAVKKQSLKNKKLDALKSTLACSHGYLSADQVAQLVSEFNFKDDKVKAAEICAPRMCSITCEQAASILRTFNFADSKIKALEAIACHITDNNLSALDKTLNFSKDRERAREIVKNRTPSGPAQPGFPPQAGVYPGVVPPAEGFPAMAPQPGLQEGFPVGGFSGMAPQPGVDPGPAPYPVYPGQLPYSSYGAPGPVLPPMGSPGGAFSAMERMMNATAGAMSKGMSDMFGPQGPQNPPPGGYP